MTSNKTNKIVVLLNNQRPTDKWKDYVKLLYKTDKNEMIPANDDQVDLTEDFNNYENTVKLEIERRKSLVEFRSVSSDSDDVDDELDESDYVDEDEDQGEKAGGKPGNYSNHEKEIFIEQHDGETKTEGDVTTYITHNYAKNQGLTFLDSENANAIKPNPETTSDAVEEFKEEEDEELDKNKGELVKLASLPQKEIKAISDLLSDTDGSDQEDFTTMGSQSTKILEARSVSQLNHACLSLKDKNAEEKQFSNERLRKNYKYFNPVIIPVEFSSKNTLLSNTLSEDSISSIALSSVESMDNVIDELLSETTVVSNRPIVKKVPLKPKTNVLDEELDDLLKELQN